MGISNSSRIRPKVGALTLFTMNSITSSVRAADLILGFLTIVIIFSTSPFAPLLEYCLINYGQCSIFCQQILHHHMQSNPYKKARPRKTHYLVFCHRTFSSGICCSYYGSTLTSKLHLRLSRLAIASLAASHQHNSAKRRCQIAPAPQNTIASGQLLLLS